ncbi:hypothetical protein C8T65DRAFT_695975 [Cerioporus squamosus]|nr:hypothetical protein C8T65DRAFT_695975 [Cerioporus squamosus]
MSASTVVVSLARRPLEEKLKMTQLGLSPGVIVGGVLVLLVITAMLAATILVVWRSRPSVPAAARTKHERKTLDVENPSPTLGRSVFNSTSLTKSIGRRFGIEYEGKELEDADENGKGKGDTSMDSTTSSDADPASPVTPVCPVPPIAAPIPAAHPSRSHSATSTVNLIISPSVPHLVKLGADGALEVRVTPPSPVLMPSAGSLRIQGISGAPGESDSVWWFI